MFLRRLVNLFIDSINFLFVFTLFNDRFTVNLLGESSLRIMFLVFILFNIFRLFRNFTSRPVLRELAPFLAFIILNFISMIVNPASPDGSEMFNNFLLLLAILIITVYFINYNRNKALYFIWFSMVSSAIILIFNPTLSEWTFRKTGGTGDPNEFASQMLAFMLVSVFMFRENKKIGFIVLSSVIFIYSIFQAASLSSFLALGVISILIMARYLRFSFTKGVIATSVLLVLITFAYLTLQEDISNIHAVQNVIERSEKTRTAQSRFASWQAGLDMIIDKPILGVGMNAYARFSPIYSKVFLDKDSVAPHNIYLKSLAETGIIVFGALLYFIFSMLSKYFHKIISTDYFWIYLSVVAYLLMGMTLGLNYNKYLWLNFALLMGIHLQISTEKRIMQIQHFRNRI